MREVISHGYELVMQKGLSGVYQCRFLELPGSDFSCNEQEDIFPESERILGDWMRQASGQKMVIPKPGAHIGFNGVIRIRSARTLRKRIDLVAMERDVSVSALIEFMLKCGADWLLNELMLTKHTSEIKLGPYRKWSASGIVARGQWTQKISPEFHYTLSWLAENERLSISALTQFLLGKVLWTVLVK